MDDLDDCDRRSGFYRQPPGGAVGRFWPTGARRSSGLEPRSTTCPRPWRLFLPTFVTARRCARALEGARWVYHLAANPNLWVRDRREFDEVNHQGTINVLDAALAAGAERILHTSTESILTKAKRDGPIDENVEIAVSDAVGPYCRSKLLAEQYAFSLANKGLPVVVANPTMPVGPGDRGCRRRRG